MGNAIDDTLQSMHVQREKLRKRREFMLNKFEEIDRADDQQLAELPVDVAEYEKIRAKKTAMKAAEERQKKLLGLDVDIDDETLVDRSTQKLQAFLRGEIEEPPVVQEDHETDGILKDLEAAGPTGNTNFNLRTKVNQASSVSSAARNHPTNINKNVTKGGKKTGKKKKSLKNGSSNVVKSGKKAVGNFVLSPIRENKRPAHDRLLEVLAREEERDMFRARTLEALEVNDPARLEEMKRVFEKERMQADRLMQKIMLDFKPTMKASRPTGEGKIHGKSVGGSPRIKETVFFASTGSKRSVSPISITTAAKDGVRVRKTFKAANMLPGSFAPPESPALPDHCEKKLIDLEPNETPKRDPIDGEQIDRDLKELLSDNSTPIDLNFPDLEMYKRRYHEREKWNEPRKYYA